MVRPSKFEISPHTDGPNLTLAVTGELDMRTLGELSESLEEQLRGGANDVTLDLRDLAFMDSSGLRLLIELNDRSRADGWRLRMLSPRHEAAALVLRVTGADKALPFEQGGEG